MSLRPRLFRQCHKVTHKLHCRGILIFLNFRSSCKRCHFNKVSAFNNKGWDSLGINGHGLLQHIALDTPLDQSRRCQLLAKLLSEGRQELPHHHISTSLRIGQRCIKGLHTRIDPLSLAKCDGLIKVFHCRKQPFDLRFFCPPIVGTERFYASKRC